MVIPNFLLGFTATPEKLDNKDVFASYHYNVFYETRLKDAFADEKCLDFITANHR